MPKNMGPSTNPLQLNGRRKSSLPKLAVLYSIVYVALSIIWPKYGQIDLPALPPFSPFSVLSIIGWVIFPLIILILRGTLKKKIARSISYRKTLLVWTTLWLSWRLVASFLGEDAIFSLRETLRDIVFLAPLIPAVIILTASPRGMQMFLRCLVLMTAATIVIAFLEILTGDTVGKIFRLTISGDTQFGLEMLNPIYRGGQLRVKSVFHHPILFSQYLAWVLPILLYFAMNTKSGIYKIIAISVIIAIPFASYWTGSRSGIISMIVSFTLYIAILFFQKQRISLIGKYASFAIFGITFLVIAVLMSGEFQNLFQGSEGVGARSTAVRFKMLEIGLDNIQHSPIWGFGDGSAAKYSGNFRGSSAFATIDNYYLSTLLNQGWVGLSLLVVAWGTILLKTTKISFASQNSLDAAFTASIVSVIMTYAIVSLAGNIALIFITAAIIGHEQVNPQNRTNHK